MLGLGSSCYTGPWNTNFVGDFLQIPDDQLKVIDNIPEWKTQIKDTNNTVSSAQSSKEICQPNNSVQPVTNSENKDKVFVPNLSKLARSNSVPDLKLLELDCHLQSTESEAKCLKMSSQPTFLRKSLFEKNPADETRPVKDNRNPNMKLSPYMSAKRKAFENLGDNIISHPFLKSAVNSEPKVSSHAEADSIKKNEKDKLASMRKKVMLLEKRFSPSKDIDETVNVSNLVSKKKSSSASQQLQSISIVEASTSQNVDKFVDRDKSSPDDTTNSVKEVILIENNQHVSEKNLAIHNGKVVAEHNEESFSSQPVSCGQIQKWDISSCKILPIMKNKTDESLPNVQCKTASFSVFSKNQLEVHDVERKKASTKRKRKNKNEKSSKKILGSRSPPYINIHYTPDQVKSMIDIIKNFNL